MSDARRKCKIVDALAKGFVTHPCDILHPPAKMEMFVVTGWTAQNPTLCPSSQWRMAKALN
ncbi:MAG: hypothetical protein NT023_11380 [Armatimonadetes bacterium]|nr:hypothetical protein [Armatimonadota bacterium]